MIYTESIIKMRNLCLFIDESGNANPKSLSSTSYILAGCIIGESSRNKLKIEADQIKFKYWDKTDIVFHSREIGRKEGDFKIFQDENLYKNFQKDLFQLLTFNNYQMLFVVVDKVKAKLVNWNDHKVYQETSNTIIKNYILTLLAQRGVKGRLVIESATAEKDFYYHKAATVFLSMGIKELDVEYKQIQQLLTEVAFVTKRNFDIEEQVSDLLAYAAKVKFEKKKSSAMTTYEKQMIKILNSKLFKMDPATGEQKRKFYSEINSFQILPI